jgi:folate-binding protein YgfZ
MTTYLLPRGVLRVAGDDAADFLDSLVTNSVDAASPEQSVFSGLLSPQGKLLADFVVHRAADGAFLLDVAADRIVELKRRLELYRLRRKVDIADLSAELAVVVRTDTQSEGAPDPRMPDGSFGIRCLLPRAEVGPTAPAEDYLAFRISRGAPDTEDAAPEEIFALEALFEELRGVDFHKGCFIGQENVSRMKRRATTRRKFCRIAFEGPPLPFGTIVKAGQAELGSVRSGVKGRGIALLRLDRARKAAADGVQLEAGGVHIRLDPPDWLILPPADDSETA